MRNVGKHNIYIYIYIYIYMCVCVCVCVCGDCAGKKTDRKSDKYKELDGKTK